MKKADSIRLLKLSGNVIFYLLVILFVFSCQEAELTEEETPGIEIETPDWTDQTHSNLVEPNYSIVFPEQVLRFDIKIEADDWQTMQIDLQQLRASRRKSTDEISATESEDPVYVPCSFKFENKEWYKVGIRYKGNSSLFSISGMKYSFKLDFDEFEETYPSINNQRFYGFKQLSLKNNFKDVSFMREKVASDLFREFGIPSARTAFCTVYVDYGGGVQYFGVYTLVEDVDDTMLDTQFGDSIGNLYKPEGAAAKFAQGTYNVNEFYKKNNEDANDYSDVRELYDIVNSTLRASDPEQWKTNLNNVFNIEHFLKWLAANTVMQNWDTYGVMFHNYYLYNNPATSQLTWIPWDNNEALMDKNSGLPNNRSPLSLSLDEVAADWPLINFIIAFDGYRQIYNSYLGQFVADVFNPSKLNVTYSEYYNLLKDFVYAEENGFTFLKSNSNFDTEVEYLENHVQGRGEAVEEYLEN